MTGASQRNWANGGADVVLLPGDPEGERHLLLDPRTSGGLSIARGRAAEIVQSIREAGSPASRSIGAREAGASKAGSLP